MAQGSLEYLIEHVRSLYANFPKESFEFWAMTQGISGTYKQFFTDCLKNAEFVPRATVMKGFALACDTRAPLCRPFAAAPY